MPISVAELFTFLSSSSSAVLKFLVSPPISTVIPLLYDRYDPEQLTVEQLKSLVWRYFMSYWNNRRICSANGGLPPMVKRSRFYAAQAIVTAV